MTTSHPDQWAPRPGAEPPDRVTMPLLTRITQQALDEDYQQAADLRARSADPPPSSRRLRRNTAVVVALFGVLITTAAVQTSRNASQAATSRAALIEEVDRRSSQVAALETQLRDLREQNTSQQARLEQVTQDAQAVAARVERLKVATGFLAVTGPGVRVVVDDAPNGDDAGRVRDEDLAILVDGLWNAGAEAISINGQRLTALAPIRSSGIAIHVNNRPISPPYVVLAIGDAAALQSRFADTTHGLEWIGLVETFKFVSDMQNEDLLALPGTRPPLLRSARLAGTDDETGKRGIAP